ncbi:hypothetical protein BOX15_Mlig005884g1, partial [Macrostomum lignano]
TPNLVAMRRGRGVGVGGAQRHAAAADRFKSKGGQLADQELAQVSAQVGAFRQHLEEFARKHADKIRRNQQFRAQFQQMCAAIGVDPLQSGKGFWSDMLGVGGFYFELGVKIIEVTMATSHKHGGLMDVSDLLKALNAGRGAGDPVSEDDIVRAVDKLRCLGNGFTLVTLGNRRLVQSVPGELSLDANSVMRLADGNGGRVTASACRTALAWAPERVDRVLDQLVREAFAWVDDGEPSGERAFWFPSLVPALLAA